MPVNNLHIMIDYIIYLLLIVSISFNIVLISIVKRQKLKIKSRPESIELTEFIHDLTEGAGLIKCYRVDSSNVFLRRPRG